MNLYLYAGRSSHRLGQIDFTGLPSIIDTSNLLPAVGGGGGGGVDWTKLLPTIAGTAKNLFGSTGAGSPSVAPAAYQFPTVSASLNVTPAGGTPSNFMTYLKNNMPQIAMYGGAAIILMLLLRKMVSRAQSKR